MVSIGASTILVLIPIVIVGIIAISVVGSLDERTRGGRIAKFFSVASDAAIFFTVLALLYQVIDSQQKSQQDASPQLLDTYSQLSTMQIDHPEIFRVIYPDVEYNQIGNNERIAVQYAYHVLNFFDRVYMMHRSGLIDDTMWKGWESWIIYTFTTGDYFLSIWHDSCGIFHTEFVNYIEQNYDDGVCDETGPQVALPDDPRIASPTPSPMTTQTIPTALPFAR